MECRAYTHRNLSSNVRQFQISSELSEQRKDLCLTFENRSRGTQRLGGLVIPVSVSEMLLTRSQLLITSDILLYFVRFNYISIFFSGCHIRNFFFFCPFITAFLNVTFVLLTQSVLMRISIFMYIGFHSFHAL